MSGPTLASLKPLRAHVHFFLGDLTVLRTHVGSDNYRVMGFDYQLLAEFFHMDGSIWIL